MAKKKQRYADDDYGYENTENFTKFNRSKKKKKGKGHQPKYGLSEGEKWLALQNEIEGGSEDVKEEENISIPSHYTAPRTPSKPRQKQFANTDGERQTVPHTFGPNTHEIKGVKIDLDGVSQIEKVESEHNGALTFGIKFIFKGTKGFNRTIWYNRFKNDRDIAFEREYSFWLSIQK